MGVTAWVNSRITACTCASMLTANSAAVDGATTGCCEACWRAIEGRRHGARCCGKPPLTCTNDRKKTPSGMRLTAMTKTTMKPCESKGE